MKRILVFAVIFIILITTACSKHKDGETHISVDDSIQEEQPTDNSNAEKEQGLTSITDNNTLEHNSSESQEKTPEQNNSTDVTVDDKILDPYTNSRSFDFDLSKSVDKAYSDFIKNLTDIYGYAVKDVDGDSISELIVQRPEAAITVYSYNGKVFETGNYEFYTGTLRLLYSDKYPGIIAFTVGNGANFYRYITIQNGELILEDIWKDYYAYDGIHITIKEEIFTNDKDLVSESESVYNSSQDISFISVE